MRAGVLLAVMGCLTCLAGGTAAAQPSPQPLHETVVVTGSVSPDSLGNVGRTLVVVAREDIERLPVTTTVDLLRLVPSVEVRARGARGVQTDFAIRGAGFGQALVLVNGARLNDAQSGHHNGDIPVSLLDVERVEVLLGGGASIHGADAFGGAINVITRRAGPRFTADLSAGQHGLVEAAAAVSLTNQPGAHVVSGELNRSTGFMPARDFDVRLARYQGTVRRRTAISLAHLDKEFGANGFYGPAPSREWTDQTLATVEHRLDGNDRWQASVDAAYRTHGDRFVWDIRQPAISDNRHRTHAVSGQARWRYALRDTTSLSVGAGGGRDRVGSSVLGERTYSRGSLVAEVRQAIGSRMVLQPGLRLDGYSRFGSSWSPALAASGWVTPTVRWRGAAGRTFRVPTFTELYYRDPNHLASDGLRPERAWSVDAGVDAFLAGWTASLTGFARRDEDVIDWVRGSASERWRTTNIQNVRTRGLEAAVVRQAGARAQWGLRYTRLASEAHAHDLLSKYVLDYAPHALAATGSTAWGAFNLGSRVGWTRRADGREYWVVDVRAGRRVGRLEVYADVANLLDTAYQEVKGVAMPGRWVKVGVKVR